MENFIFSLNATMPIFLLMVIGYLLKKINIINDDFLPTLNKFVFNIALPALVFKDIGETDFINNWDGKFVLFCFFATIISIMIGYFVSLLMKNKEIQGEFVQASYRSSAAIFGVAFIKNIYGTVSVAPLMIIGAVPLYNAAAVVILSVLKPERDNIGKDKIINTFKGIVTNPIILGILAGILWSLTGIEMPVIMNKTLESLGNLATPLGLIAVGGAFDLSKAFNKLKPALVSTFFKLIGFTMIFLPIAIWLGYRNEFLVNILTMLGSATTVSCYIMAKNMGHEGVLTSSVVMLTTMLCSFTLTFWLFILKTMMYI